MEQSLATLSRIEQVLTSDRGAAEAEGAAGAGDARRSIRALGRLRGGPEDWAEILLGAGGAAGPPPPPPSRLDEGPPTPPGPDPARTPSPGAGSSTGVSHQSDDETPFRTALAREDEAAALLVRFARGGLAALRARRGLATDRELAAREVLSRWLRAVLLPRQRGRCLRRVLAARRRTSARRLCLFLRRCAAQKRAERAGAATALQCAWRARAARRTAAPARRGGGGGGGAPSEEALLELWARRASDGGAERRMAPEMAEAIAGGAGRGTPPRTARPAARARPGAAEDATFQDVLRRFDEMPAAAFADAGEEAPGSPFRDYDER